MFEDPRSGIDRRAPHRQKRRKHGERRHNVIDRRVYGTASAGNPWWLQRHYFVAEKFRVRGV